MGIVTRQGIKSSVVIYFGVIIGYINVVLLSPKILTAEQIGLTRLLYDTGLFIGIIAQLGIWNVAIKFYPYFRNSKNNNNGFLFWFTVIPFFSLLIILSVLIFNSNYFIGLFSDKSSLISDYYFLLIPMIVFAMYYQIFETYSSLQYRTVVPNLIKEVLNRILYLVLILLMLQKAINFDQFINGYIFAYGGSLVLLILYLLKIKKIDLKPDFSFINIQLKRDIISYWIFVFLGTLGAFVISKIDIIMISSIDGLRATGIYSIAFLIASLIEIPRRVIVQISVPIISEACKNNDLIKLRELYQKSSLTQMLVTGIVFILIWINIDYIFQFIPNSKVYAEGKYVVFFIGLSRFIDASTGLNTEILMNSDKHYKFNLILMLVVGVIALFLNYSFIKAFGFIGAAYSVCASMLIYNVIKFTYIRLKIKMQPFNLKTVIALMLLACCLSIHYMLPVFVSPVLNLFLNISLIGGIFSFFTIYLNISEDFTSVFKNIVTKRKLL